MLDGDVSDHVEAESLSLNPQHIDIYSASWGPDDNGKVVDGPAKLAKEAFVQGILKVVQVICTFFVLNTGTGHGPYVCKFRQLLSIGRWFPPGTPVSSTSETDIS